MEDDFYGLPTGSLGNSYLRLEYLAEAGPRVVRLFLAGSEENLLAELPDVHWETPYGAYYPRGGHRLWYAPEANPRTYVPDDGGLVVESVDGGVLLCQPTEEETGIAKALEIRLHPDRPALTLHHRLRNDGLWAVELAPWAITQLPLGGVGILPQQSGPLDPHGLLPNRCLVLWPYTRWDDPRLHLHDDYVLVKAEAQLPPCKVGYMNRQGWAAYIRGGVLFCKRFCARPKSPHPDMGCNTEVYCNDLFFELETVAPLCRLEPGQTVVHTEIWEFYVGLAVPRGLEELRRLLGEVGPRLMPAFLDPEPGK
jgi:hypothetical protein